MKRKLFDICVCAAVVAVTVGSVHAQQGVRHQAKRLEDFGASWPDLSHHLIRRHIHGGRGNPGIRPEPRPYDGKFCSDDMPEYS